jgi:hypothetical protein
MPKNIFPGKKIDSCINYFESILSFEKINTTQQIINIKKPVEQGSLDDDRVDKMVVEYKQNPLYLKFKNKIIIGVLNNIWYVIDGQHRLDMCKKLYEENPYINDNLVFCWYILPNENEMRKLFNSVNHDSYKNKFYIDCSSMQQVKINEFVKLLKHNKSLFSTKKSTGKIKSIEEFRDELIDIKFFDNTKTARELYDTLLSKNDIFYRICNYDYDFYKFSDQFYKDDHSKIEEKKIISLKNANFVKWLQDEINIKPHHILKKGKNRITRKSKLECWENEFPNMEFATCPISNCSVILDKNSDNWNAGHIISEYNGGKICKENLRPICKSCNCAMGSKNWNDYDIINK